MSRSTTSPLIPSKPAEISIDTLPQLFAHHRAVFGGWTMNTGAGTAQGGQAGQGGSQQGSGTGQGQQGNDSGQSGQGGGQGGQQPAERPDGVTEAEWNALSDPGRAAIVREREARQAAERALAAARARPTAPGNQSGNQGQGGQGQGGGQQQGGQSGQGGGQQGSGSGGQNGDVASIVQQAVAAALKPFQEREEQREAAAAVERIQTTVLEAAKATFLDPTDALAGIDLTQVTDGHGNVDRGKVDQQLQDLLTRKPHLAKSPDGRRYAAPGSAAGAGGASPNLEAKVQETLSRMQAAAGLKQTTSS